MESLIKQAIEASPDFAWRMSYWVHTRKKQPDLHWILEQLVDVLGIEAVEAELIK